VAEVRMARVKAVVPVSGGGGTVLLDAPEGMPLQEIQRDVRELERVYGVEVLAKLAPSVPVGREDDARTDLDAGRRGIEVREFSLVNFRDGSSTYYLRNPETQTVHALTLRFSEDGRILVAAEARTLAEAEGQPLEGVSPGPVVTGLDSRALGLGREQVREMAVALSLYEKTREALEEGRAFFLTKAEEEVLQKPQVQERGLDTYIREMDARVGERLAEALGWERRRIEDLVEGRSVEEEARRGFYAEGGTIYDDRGALLGERLGYYEIREENPPRAEWVQIEVKRQGEIVAGGLQGSGYEAERLAREIRSSLASDEEVAAQIDQRHREDWKEAGEAKWGLRGGLTPPEKEGGEPEP
jgi:hypothetical protein